MEHLNLINILSVEHEEIARDIDVLQDKAERVLQQAQDRALGLTPNAQEQELNEIMELVRCLHNKICSHFYKEEQPLFQIMEESLSDRRCTAILRDEHKEILERYFRLTDRLGDWKSNVSDLEKASKLERALWQFINSFRSHAHREEQILYPMARACLSEEQLTEIGRRIKG